MTAASSESARSTARPRELGRNAADLPLRLTPPPVLAFRAMARFDHVAGDLAQGSLEPGCKVPLHGLYEAVAALAGVSARLVAAPKATSAPHGLAKPL